MFWISLHQVPSLRLVLVPSTFQTKSHHTTTRAGVLNCPPLHTVADLPRHSPEAEEGSSSRLERPALALPPRTLPPAWDIHEPLLLSAEASCTSVSAPCAAAAAAAGGIEEGDWGKGWGVGAASSGGPSPDWGILKEGQGWGRGPPPPAQPGDVSLELAALERLVEERHAQVGRGRG